MHTRLPLRGSVRIALSLAAAGSLLLVAGSASAATYEVGPGKQYAGLADVAKTLKPGDVVNLYGGATYPGGVAFWAPGTAAAKITIRGIPVDGKRPVIAGGTGIDLAADHYVVEGVEITGGSPRCVFHHADDITIRDSVIHDCPSHGILSADDMSGSLTLDHVEVYASGSGDTHHPIYVASDETHHPRSVFRMENCYVHDNRGGNAVKSRSERNEIRYNWIDGGPYRALELIGPDGQEPGLAREDSDVVGNLLRGTTNFALVRIGGDGTGATGGRYRFVENTFVTASADLPMFQLFDQVESLEIHNSVFYRAGGGPVILMKDADAAWTTGARIVTGSNNWVPTGSTAVPTEWTGTLTGADPGFENAGALDFRPKAVSPLVGRAAASTASPAASPFPSPLPAAAGVPPLHELDDAGVAIPRAAGHDIGAFAHEGIGTAHLDFTGIKLRLKFPSLKL